MLKGITRDQVDKLATSKLLASHGATIQELNAVRKHLSSLKGGKLAQLAQPADVLGLILSDVIGDPLDVIASGPIVPDPTTFGDAVARHPPRCHTTPRYGPTSLRWWGEWW